MSGYLSDAQRTELSQNGCLVLRGLLDSDQVARLNSRLDELWRIEGENAGKENTYVEPHVRRLANLAAKGLVFRSVFNHSTVLEAAKTVLGPRIHLAMLNAREVLPEASSKRQPFHTDTDRNQNDGKPDAKGFFTCTAVWLLTESTLTNGATRVMPGTHLSGKLPEEALEDCCAPQPEEVLLEGNPGDVCVLNGHCWHCGGANHSERPRRALLAHYVRPDVHRDPHRRQTVPTEMVGQLSADELQLLGVAS